MEDVELGYEVNTYVFFNLNPAVKVYQSSRAIFSVFNLFASATFNRTIKTTQN